MMAITEQSAEHEHRAEQEYTAVQEDVTAQRARATLPWLPHALALGSLALLFLWIYLRFAGKLYFVLDDYIESEVALARPLVNATLDSFTGAINWSGYRPVSYALRALLVHTFGIERLTGYYLFILLLHFANTLLAYHLVWRIARSAMVAYLAAAFFLLLPSHNEAVLYFSASANLIALFFALLALEFALEFGIGAPRLGEADSTCTSTRWWAIFGAAFAYWLAILSYEVTLPLILLILLADWWQNAAHNRMRMGDFARMRLGFYGALVIAALLAMAMRFAWGGGILGAPRADYGASFAPPHLAYGYTMLLSQMALLYNSPWLYLPDFVYTRDWIAWSNPRALVSLAMAFGLTLATMWVAWRTRPFAAKRRDACFWALWGILWLLLVSLPFAALDGRNPENRYTYIPSFGAAILVAALFVLALGWLQKRGWQRIGVPTLIVLVSSGLAFYAWVDTSDVAEWERAAVHARAFVSAVDAMPIQGKETLAEVGVPGGVGSAYVFGTAESLAAALRLHGAMPNAEIASGDLPLRSALEDLGFDPTIVLYDPNSHGARIAQSAALCAENPTPENCVWSTVTPDPAQEGAAWVYAQIYDVQNPEAGGLGMIVQRGEPAQLVHCWHFYDAKRITIDPGTFDNDAVNARCQVAFQTIAPAIP